MFPDQSKKHPAEDNFLQQQRQFLARVKVPPGMGGAISTQFLDSLKQLDMACAVPFTSQGSQDNVLLQEVSLQSVTVSRVDLLNCAELRSLSFPQLDQAIAQQLAGPLQPAGSKKKPKVLTSCTCKETTCCASSEQWSDHCYVDI